ncbi:hypothetical protein C8R43DRAFT_872306, partial [Mycena crocata]
VFFRYWEPSLIFLLGRLNYRLLNIVRFYQATVWNVPDFLRRWFTRPETVLRFLRDGPAVFCGPSVLQFFDRKGHDATRLDMCVGFEGFLEAGRFLAADGYIFRADASSTVRDFEVVCLMEAAYVPERRLRVDGDRSLTQQEHGSRSFRFVKPGRRSPLHIVVLHLVRCEFHRFILSGHSTALMNFISSTHAFSIFPRSAFVKRKSFVACQERLSATDATVNFESRWLSTYESDFGIFDIVGATIDVDHSAETGRRYIGDSRCWTISCFSGESPLAILPASAGPAFDVLDWRFGVTRHGSYLRVGEPFIWR